MPARHMLVALLLKSSRYDEAIPVVEQVFEADASPRAADMAGVARLADQAD